VTPALLDLFVFSASWHGQCLFFVCGGRTLLGQLSSLLLSLLLLGQLLPLRFFLLLLLLPGQLLLRQL
jgi:hypothetical protein